MRFTHAACAALSAVVLTTTASAQGCAISVAPLLMPAMRATADGQANFIGMVCTRASA